MLYLAGQKQRRRLLMALLGLFLASASWRAWPTTNEDVVWLRSGERLRGTITGMSPEGRFHWRHPFIAEDLEVALTNVLKIRFALRQSPTNTLHNACQIRLVNGDTLSGNLVAFDGGHLVMESPACGQLKIPRDALEGLQPKEVNPQVVFQGPNGLEGWTLGQAVAGVENDAWLYGNGALIAHKAGSIARDVKLPDLAEISFNLEWEGTPTLAVALYTDRLQPIQLIKKDDEPEFGGFYSLQITLGGFLMATLVPVKQKVPLNPQGLGIAIHQNRTLDSQAQFMIRVNKKDRTVLLYYNGELIRQWQDPMDTLGNGTALRFVNQGMGTLRLSQLDIRRWDGRQSLQTNVLTQGTNDLIVLLNQDRLSGVLGAFRQNEWEVQTPLGLVQVPVSRIEQVHFSQARRRPPPKTGAPARLTLASKDRLAVHLVRWDETHLNATHPLLGPMQIHTTALREMVFD